MAAGDLVVADFTFELRTTLFGEGTNCGVDRKNISGLFGVPGAKDADVDQDDADGSWAAPDYQGKRIIIFPIVFDGTASQVGGWLKTWVTTLWVPAGSNLTVPLYGQWPGWGKFYVNGSPRGLDSDVSRGDFGTITAEATFVCPDPTIHFV